MAAERLSEPEQHIETRDEKRYKKLLEEYLSPATFLIIFALCLFVFRFPQPASEQIADTLAMDEDECAMIIPPLARLLDKKHFDQDIKQKIVESGEWAGLAVGLSSYGLRVYGALQDIGRSINESRQQTTSTPVQPLNNPGENRNGAYNAPNVVVARGLQ